MTDLSTGLYLHASVLAALLGRERTGVGMRVECSLLETQVASLVNVASAYLNAGAGARPMGTYARMPLFAHTLTAPCIRLLCPLRAWYSNVRTHTSTLAPECAR
jgi:crotonobetainyl-CoA:carnitine CoA-transferase CaiB-like acyl-CoA transferase